jgi:hypothetical protein
MDQLARAALIGDEATYKQQLHRFNAKPRKGRFTPLLGWLVAIAIVWIKFFVLAALLQLIRSG